MAALLSFVVGTVFMAACLWIGARITRVDGTFATMLAIAAVSSLLLLLPLVGWLVALIVMFALINRWTDADIWPDAVLMVIVATVVGWLVSFFLPGL